MNFATFLWIFSRLSSVLPEVGVPDNLTLTLSVFNFKERMTRFCLQLEGQWGRFLTITLLHTYNLSCQFLGLGCMDYAGTDSQNLKFQKKYEMLFVCPVKWKMYAIHNMEWICVDSVDWDSTALIRSHVRQSKRGGGPAARKETQNRSWRERWYNGSLIFGTFLMSGCDAVC